MVSKSTAAAAAGCLTWRLFGPFTLHAPLRPHSLISAVNRRQCSSEQATQQDEPPKRSTFRPVATSTHDWIGPPNPLSNLRPIVYHVPANETELEKRLRHLRQETEDWNHDFWAKQNITFSKEKDTFIISELNAKGLSLRDEQGRRRSLNSEEMAVFYKSFLDRNRIRHANYNNEWYRRNFTITLLMARVSLKNMWRTVTNRHSGKKNSTPTT
ncbi:cytochrome c oxidase assembly factor 8-like [Micropterus salmoides]|uniref:cytochrome c oxidase assembly factor 8-like n=1 Tax=Micropterus salmoides TaxID=27706 RepID=UPI0018EC9641|nr:cytochrome c oxidase assembly factor 8-like [Micropterus salmoides]XP_038584248.1 cytochrome c oxidase assembly factor 8-like [Micropterus salmoides]